EDVDRRLRPHRERQLAEPLRRLRADGDGADERALVRVGEEADEAVALRPLVGGEPRRRRELPACGDALGDADRRDLGVGEDAGRDRAVVGPDVAAREVADRPHALAGAAALVDLDPRASDRQPEPLEPLDVRPAAGGDEQPLRLDRLAVREPKYHVVTWAVLGSLDGDAGAHVDAVLREGLADELARLLVHAAEEPWAVLDHGHARADAREELRELRADGAAAEHGERPRYLLDRGRLDVRPVLDAVEAVDRRNRRPRAGRDHEAVVLELAGALDRDDAGALDTAESAHELAALAREPFDLPVVVTGVDDPVAPLPDAL